MARADTAAALPWLLGGGVLAGGAFLLWRHREAQAAPTAPSPTADPSTRPLAASPLTAASVVAHLPFVPPTVVAAVAGATAAPAVPTEAPMIASPAAPGLPPSTAPVTAPPPSRAPSSQPPTGLAASASALAAPSAVTAANVIAHLPFVPPTVVTAVSAATGTPRAPAPAVATVAAPAVAATVEPRGPAWVWPLLRWGGYAPDISDGWGSVRDGGARRHHGADLMYPRRSRADRAAEFPPTAPHSPGFFMPPGALAVAAADGEIWSARRTSRGYAITLAHADGWATFYQHLATMFVPALDHGTGRIRVVAGQALGIVGADPTQGRDAIAHLHFELRKGVTPIDPRPALRAWRVLAAPTKLPPIEAVVTPPAPLRDPREAALLARIYATHGRGLPVAYLAALGRAESGGNAHHPMGVLNITRVALDEYNRRHPAAPIAVVQLRDPIAAVTVASWVLREIIASYRAHHRETPHLQENWTNPEFVALLTAGWNAGHSEAAGVGLVAAWLVAHGLPVTLANVFTYAKRAGAAATLSDPHKRRFAERVTKDYQATAGGRS